MGNNASRNAESVPVRPLTQVPEVFPLHKETSVLAGKPLTFNVSVLKGKCMPKSVDGSHCACVAVSLYTYKFQPQCYRTREVEGRKVDFDQGFTFSVHPGAMKNAAIDLRILTDSGTVCRAHRQIPLSNYLPKGTSRADNERTEEIVFGGRFCQDSSQGVPSLKIQMQLVSDSFDEFQEISRKSSASESIISCTGDCGIVRKEEGSPDKMPQQNGVCVCVCLVAHTTTTFCHKVCHVFIPCVCVPCLCVAYECVQLRQRLIHKDGCLLQQ